MNRMYDLAEYKPENREVVRAIQENQEQLESLEPIVDLQVDGDPRLIQIQILHHDRIPLIFPQNVLVHSLPYHLRNLVDVEQLQTIMYPDHLQNKQPFHVIYTGEVKYEM